MDVAAEQERSRTQSGQCVHREEWVESTPDGEHEAREMDVSDDDDDDDGAREKEKAKQDWALQMRLEFSNPDMLAHDGSLRQSYFRPAQARAPRSWNKSEERILTEYAVTNLL